MANVGFSGGAPKDDSQPKKKRGNNGGGRKKGVTPRVKLYAEMLLKSKGKLSKKECALAVGFPESMANNVKKKIEDPNRDFFQRIGDVAIPDEILWGKLREGLDATTVKTASLDGVITDMQEFVDFETRRKYLETAAEWKGRVLRRGASQPLVNMPITLVHSIPRPNYGNGSDNNGS